MKIIMKQFSTNLSLTSIRRIQIRFISTNPKISGNLKHYQSNKCEPTVRKKVTISLTTKKTISTTLKEQDKHEVVCGLDEAGRGSVLGPLVICAAAMTKDFESMLRQQGMKDSKLLSEKKREMFYEMLKDHADPRNHENPKFFYKVTHILPHTIDKKRLKQTLNTIELKSSIVLIRSLIKDTRQHLSLSEPSSVTTSGLQSLLFEGLLEREQTIGPVWDTLYIDALTTKEDQYGDPFREKFSKDVKNIVSVNKADTLFTCVGAASVIAKVERDRAVKALEKKYKVTIGSGYPSDSITVQFLKEWSASHDQLPDFVRLSWGTVTNLLKQKAKSE